MSESKVIDILKKAIVLEQQGRSFYLGVAEHTESDAVRNIFSIMAEEERMHEQVLTEQATRYSKGEAFSVQELGAPEEFSREVLSAKITGQITAASYEAASISAAMSMEKNAVELYSRRAEETSDEAEKALYSELARWEKTHLAFLSDIYNDLLESSWYQAGFWPF